ncbi:glycosyltransferase family 87 protein [Paraburkholderia dinghuensis]|uniref:DUF2029 domain-containing protein n=1 Tax=Paraburkholderia dinghuensis TaxID=2305225 RepID=A0A3N6N1Q2_9BURK|nr:glycosyltransferase family 87 protein [Paraburkholderia dinghuensis]RQH08375.1 DUF2029 domain-containing protein [Paraburkholderia dinghuensis]
MRSLHAKRAGVSRLTVYALAALAVQIISLAIWIVRFYFLEDHSSPMVGIDFAIFWSAARVAMVHGAASVFSPQWMLPTEVALGLDQYSVWPYPPTFLLAVLPFGLLRFGAALMLYSLLGVLLYGAVLAHFVRRLDRAWLPPLLAFPGIAIAIGLGQNSLFTVAAAGAALALIETDAGLAGLCIAMLAIKPQFGVLFPLALVCGRHWKVFGVSALCALAFVAISVVVFGLDAWSAFATFLPQFNTMAVTQGGSMMWPGMPTTFALGRSAGLSVNAAYLLHGLVAVPAVLAMAFLWAQRARFELRASSLIIATLLVQPYVMFYDLAWLILPLVLLIRDNRTSVLVRMEWVVIAAAWLAPAQALLSAYCRQYLNILPAVMIALLVIVMRRHLATTRYAGHEACMRNTTHPAPAQTRGDVANRVQRIPPGSQTAGE